MIEERLPKRMERLEMAGRRPRGCPRGRRREGVGSVKRRGYGWKHVE